MLPLSQRDVFHSVAFWLGALYVTFPMGLLLYGWNDIVDYEADRLNPRKGTFLFGARGVQCSRRCKDPAVLRRHDCGRGAL